MKKVKKTLYPCANCGKKYVANYFMKFRSEAGYKMVCTDCFVFLSGGKK